MKKILFPILLMSFSTFGQTKEVDSEDADYEDIIAAKACACLFKLESTPNARQAVIKCIIQATNKVHKVDVDKKYTRDFTVEGIRKLNKNVTNTLLKKCSILSIE